MLLIVAPLVLSLRRPEDHPAAMQVALAALVAMVLTMALTAFDAFTVVLLALGALLTALHPARSEVLRLAPRRSALSFAAVAIAVPLVVHALDQAALQRTSDDAHASLDHYAGAAAAAVAIALVALLAPMAARSAKLPAVCAGLGLAVLGAAWLLFPEQSSSLGAAWGALAIAGGAGFVALASGRPAPAYGTEGAPSAR